MKKSILTLALTMFAAGTIFTSCNSSSEKVENAEENLKQASQDLDKANEEYFTEIEKYRKDAAEKFTANEQSIIAFNARIENEKAEAKADYRNKIAELEQKNTDIKRRMDDYKAISKEEWETFKAEFNHDMEELGKAFYDLTAKNVK